MFSGIVAAVGKVVRVSPQGDDLCLSFGADSEFMDEIKAGDSVMVNGVCLTVVEVGNNMFTAQVSAETLSCTTLGGWREGEAVNLEPALRFGGGLDGHLVSGHVDAVGRVVSREADADSERFEIELPTALVPLVARKGSVCVDGVSLTVNEVSDATFDVNIIRYTLENTNFSRREPGDAVNLEADLIARYVARYLARGA